MSDEAYETFMEATYGPTEQELKTKMYDIIQDGDCWDEPMTLAETVNHLRGIAEALHRDSVRIERTADALENSGEPIEYGGSYIELEVVEAQ